MAQQQSGAGKPDVQTKEIPNKPAVQPKNRPDLDKPGVTPPAKPR